MGRLDGKVALITGAGMGLGRALADLFANEGANVVLSDIAEEEGAAAAREIGDAAMFVRHDVSDEKAWAQLERKIAERFGRLDILVNNAAIMIPGSIEALSFADWKRMQAVNADSAFLGCQTAVRMMKDKGGSIVNIASVASHTGEPYAAGYCAAKGAIRSLTKSIAIHCQDAGYSIRCNSVHPGGMDTPMVRKLRADAGLEGANPEWAQPIEIANAVLFLASDEASFITGTELLVDNGRTARPPSTPLD